MKKYLITSGIAFLALVSVAGAQNSITFSNNLSVGMRSPDVSILQSWLIDNGYSIPAIVSGIVSKGFFGSQTRMAVMRYQMDNGIPNTGYFGRMTRARLNGIYHSNINAPIINSVSGPTTLAVGASGTWTISATDPSNGQLTYSVIWGDETNANAAPMSGESALYGNFTQSATFTHTYWSKTPAEYNIRFAVRNSAGRIATKNVTVNVGGYAGSSLKVISPNGGESWQIGTTQNVTWTAPQYFRATYADIKLIPANRQLCKIAPCPEYYPNNIRYVIAANVSINQNSFSWKVGDYVPEVMTMIYPPQYPIVPAGQYIVQICETGTSNCDSSDSSFNIYTSTSSGGNISPVINGINAPTTLKVGETGTWTVRASDPQNSTLQYVVDWGDVFQCPIGYACNLNPTALEASFTQNAIFSHSYSNPGIYTVKFTVRNGSGYTAQSSATVQVSSSGGGIGDLRIISPNGGETWSANSIHQISWSATNFPQLGTVIDGNMKIDLYLDQNIYCITTPCGTNYVLDKNIPVSMIYNWIVATDINNYAIPAGNYRVRICTAGSTANCDSSDNFFTINR